MHYIPHRVQLLDDGNFGSVTPRTHLEEFNPAPAKKMFDRLKSFSRPTLSIVARSTGYNTFILSVMPFFTVLFWTHKTTFLRLAIIWAGVPAFVVSALKISSKRTYGCHILIRSCTTARCLLLELLPLLPTW